MMTKVLLFTVILAGAAMGWETIEVDGFILSWQTQAGDSLGVELTGPTTGWVAVGFDPSMMMFEANIIIGYVQNDDTYIRDDWGWQTTSHRADSLLGGTSDVTTMGGWEEADSTHIQFVIPLDSGDEYDKPLSPGNTYSIILARGPDGADDFSTQHEFMTTAEIEILPLTLQGTTWGRAKTTNH